MGGYAQFTPLQKEFARELMDISGKIRNQRTLLSVKNLIDISFPAFDSEKKAAEIAAARGTTAEAVLKDWSKTATTASDRGNNIESQVLSALLDVADNHVAQDFVETLRKKGNGLGMHQSYVSDGQIRGKFDSLFFGEPENLLAEYKSADLGIDLDRGYDVAIPPMLRGMTNSKINMYSLQIRLYQHCLYQMFGSDLKIKPAIVVFEPNSWYQRGPSFLYEATMLDEYIAWGVENRKTA